jgi:hypothetical protein
MSALGQKQTYVAQQVMSAFGPKKPQRFQPWQRDRELRELIFTIGLTRARACESTLAKELPKLPIAPQITAQRPLLKLQVSSLQGAEAPLPQGARGRTLTDLPTLPTFASALCRDSGARSSISR